MCLLTHYQNHPLGQAVPDLIDPHSPILCHSEPLADSLGDWTLEVDVKDTEQVDRVEHEREDQVAPGSAEAELVRCRPLRSRLRARAGHSGLVGLPG